MRSLFSMLRFTSVPGLVLVFACAEDPAPPFEVEGSGRLSGRLFFDADNNRLFTPLGGDTLLSNVQVEVRERGSSVTIATTTTDADGSFTFEALPTGTHDVFLVQDANVTGTLVFCENPMRASVYRDETAFVSAPARRGCVVAIAVAEANPVGTRVTVTGTVTAAQGTYRGDNVYIQDRTGGIQVFRVPGLNLQLGDSIEVFGTLVTFNGEIQLDTLTISPNIGRGGTQIAPIQRSTRAIASAVTANAARATEVGQLLVVRRARIGAFTSGGTPPRNATLTDTSNVAIELRIDGNVLNVLPTNSFDQTKCYDIIGILGYFSGTPQLKPRVPSDVTEVPCQ
jgi:hypothetical protein